MFVVGIVCRPNEELHEEVAWPAGVVPCLVQMCNLVFLVHGSHVPATRGKVRVPGGRTFIQNCVKKPGAHLAGVVNQKLWRGQMGEPVPHMPVHDGRSSRVVVAAQEVDGLAVLKIVMAHSQDWWQLDASFLGAAPCGIKNCGIFGQISEGGIRHANRCSS